MAANTMPIVMPRGVSGGAFESPMPIDVWLEAAQLYRTARAAGTTIRSAADCLIATCALRHDLEVLHRDYAQLARVSPLRVRQPGGSAHRCALQRSRSATLRRPVAAKPLRRRAAGTPSHHRTMAPRRATATLTADMTMRVTTGQLEAMIVQRLNLAPLPAPAPREQSA